MTVFFFLFISIFCVTHTKIRDNLRDSIYCAHNKLSEQQKPESVDFSPFPFHEFPYTHIKYTYLILLFVVVVVVVVVESDCKCIHFANHLVAKIKLVQRMINGIMVMATEKLGQKISSEWIYVFAFHVHKVILSLAFSCHLWLHRLCVCVWVCVWVCVFVAKHMEWEKKNMEAAATQKKNDSRTETRISLKGIFPEIYCTRHIVELFAIIYL